MARYVNLKRQNGKTTMLIYASYVTGYPIITRTVDMKRFVITMAQKLGLDIQVYSLSEWMKFNHSRQDEKVLIDEAQSIIDFALNEMLHAEVVAASFSIPMDELPAKTNNEEVKKCKTQ